MAARESGPGATPSPGLLGSLRNLALTLVAIVTNAPGTAFYRSERRAVAFAATAVGRVSRRVFFRSRHYHADVVRGGPVLGYPSRARHDPVCRPVSWDSARFSGSWCAAKRARNRNCFQPVSPNWPRTGSNSPPPMFTDNLIELARRKERLIARSEQQRVVISNRLPAVAEAAPRGRSRDCHCALSASPSAGAGGRRRCFRDSPSSQPVALGRARPVLVACLAVGERVDAEVRRLKKILR